MIACCDPEHPQPIQSVAEGDRLLGHSGRESCKTRRMDEKKRDHLRIDDIALIMGIFGQVRRGDRRPHSKLSRDRRKIGSTDESNRKADRLATKFGDQKRRLMRPSRPCGDSRMQELNFLRPFGQLVARDERWCRAPDWPSTRLDRWPGPTLRTNKACRPIPHLAPRGPLRNLPFSPSDNPALPPAHQRVRAAGGAALTGNTPMAVAFAEPGCHPSLIRHLHRLSSRPSRMR